MSPEWPLTPWRLPANKLVHTHHSRMFPVQMFGQISCRRFVRETASANVANRIAVRLPGEKWPDPRNFPCRGHFSPTTFTGRDYLGTRFTGRPKKWHHRECLPGTEKRPKIKQCVYRWFASRKTEFRGRTTVLRIFGTKFRTIHRYLVQSRSKSSFTIDD